MPNRCKRRGNQNLKTRRAASWTRGRVHKKARREAQEEREAVNKWRRENGEMTPWQYAKHLRAKRRSKVAA